MGNDGGSIPKRRELVQEAARLPTASEIKETQQEQQGYHWTTCPLSHQPLKPPIVSDSSGMLYNKDAILEFLLPAGDGTPGMSKSDNEEVLDGRVRSLRDVVEVKFSTAEDGGEGVKGRASPKAPKWVCPITNKALGPGVKAVYLVPCGHAFLEAAVKEVPGDNCLQCNEPYTTDNVVSIIPIFTAEKERMGARAQKLKEQGLTHSLKKAPGSGKKRKKHGDSETVVVSSDQTPNEVTNGGANPKAGSQKNSGTATPTGGIKNAATASLTARVLADEQGKAKRRQLDTNENLKSLFSSGKSKNKDGDFMTRGFSIPAGAKR
ncbi:hypothetical protein MMC30_008949 [Trapelia coarctata]|nr:hypothetical protein [Trapelia coarctata]